MLFIWLLIAAAIIVVDQLIKYWVVAHLAVNTAQTLIPHVFGLLHVRNTGAAWSILEGQTWFFYVFTGIAVLVILYLLFRKSQPSKLFELGLSFILGGVLGNFIDRVRLGYVVDMFQLKFINFPIFNLADMFVVTGVILVFIYLIFLDKESER